MRKLSAFEKGHFAVSEYLQLGLGISKPEFVSRVVQNCLASSPIFWLKSDGEYIYSTKEKPLIFDIPNYITSVQEGCDYMQFYKRISPESRVGVIGINEKLVVISSHHCMIDGGHAFELFHDANTGPSMPLVEMPVSYFDHHKEELDKITSYDNFMKDCSELLVFRPKNKEFHSVPTDPCIYHSTINKGKDLICYDHKSNKLVDYTHFMNASMVLTGCAYNNDLSKLGIATLANLRAFDKVPMGTKCLDNWCEINVVANNLNPKQSFGNLIKQFKQKLIDFRKPEVMRECLKATAEMHPYSCLINGGLILLSSSMGLHKPTGMLNDVWVQATMNSIEPHVYLVNQTISKIVHGELQVVTRLQAPPTQISSSEFDVYAQGLDFTMKNIPLELSLDKAVEEISKFMNKYRKDHF